MKNPERVRVGRNIRRLRISNGWTQEELAERSGLHPTYIGGIERRERNFGIDNLFKIAKALGQDPGNLLRKAQ